MQLSSTGFDFLKALKTAATLDRRADESSFDLIEGFEGLRLKAYLDIAGVPTIGWGSTYYENGKKVKMGDVITREHADRLLVNTVRNFEKDVNRLVKVPLTENQFDAVLSFHYNTGALASSTLLKKLNAGDYQGAADEFPKWNKITKNGIKVVSSILVKRRAAERKLFLTA